jgi:hypothetical protein
LNEHLASLSVLFSSHAGAAVSETAHRPSPSRRWLRAAGICAVEARDVERNGAPKQQA